MVDQATHHGPWCDVEPRRYACKACAPITSFPAGGVPMAQGAWLFARLAVHHHYNRGLAKKQQEPLWGIMLNAVDNLEVARLTLILAEAKMGMMPRERV